MSENSIEKSVSPSNLSSQNQNKNSRRKHRSSQTRKIVITGGNSENTDRLLESSGLSFSVETEQEHRKNNPKANTRHYSPREPLERKQPPLPQAQAFNRYNFRSYAQPKYHDNKLFIGGLQASTSEKTVTTYFEKYGEIELVSNKNQRGFVFVTFKQPACAEAVLLQHKHIIDGKLVEVKKALQKDENYVPGASYHNNGYNSPSYYRPGPMYPQQVPLPYYNPYPYYPSPVPTYAIPKAPEELDELTVTSFPQDANKLFVGGLHPKTTQEDLKEYFSSFGTVDDVTIMIDNATQKPRGFGFITFTSENVAKMCLEQTQHTILGKSVDVKTAVLRNRTVLNPQPMQNFIGYPGYIPHHHGVVATPASGFHNYSHHNMSSSIPAHTFLQKSSPAAAPQHASQYTPSTSTTSTASKKHQSDNSVVNTPQSKKSEYRENRVEKQEKNSNSEKSNNKPEKVIAKNTDMNNNVSNQAVSESAATVAATTASTPIPNINQTQPASSAIISQQLSIMQMPTLGPNYWGGFHPQHSHQLTYAKIFIGGLKRDTTKHGLEKHFSQFGKVRKLDLVMDPQSDARNRGFAFVQFETVEACEAACQRQFHTVDGHSVEVKRAVLKPPGCGGDVPGINAASTYPFSYMIYPGPVGYHPVNYDPYSQVRYANSTVTPTVPSVQSLPSTTTSKTAEQKTEILEPKEAGAGDAVVTKKEPNAAIVSESKQVSI